MAIAEEVLEVIDIRCPHDSRHLLMRYAKTEGHISSNNLMMLSCRTCTRTARETDQKVVRVVHHFDLAGGLVESTVERRPVD